MKDIEYTGKYFARVIAYISPTTWITVVKLGSMQLTAVAAMEILLELLKVKLWDTISESLDDSDICVMVT